MEAVYLAVLSACLMSSDLVFAGLQLSLSNGMLHGGCKRKKRSRTVILQMGFSQSLILSGADDPSGPLRFCSSSFCTFSSAKKDNFTSMACESL